MSWRIAESLKQLRRQIDELYPDRDKTSDGAIGDASHASRNSDHNPWVFDGEQGVVTAIDIDADLAGHDTLDELIKAICASGDRRVKYIIWKGRITVKGSRLKRWKKYTGKNSHSAHAHISVFSDRKLYDDTSDWDIGIPMIRRTRQVASAKTDTNDHLQAEPDEMPSVSSVQPQEQSNLETPQIPSLNSPVDATPAGDQTLGATSDVELRKERPSLWTRIVAAFTVGTGTLATLGLNVQSMIERATAEITATQVFVTVSCLAIAGLGIWLYDRSAQRSNRVNLAKLHAAADQAANTVELR